MIDFLTIEHNGGDLANEDASKITIEFSAIVNNHASLVNGDSVSISAGADYLSGTKVWVGQLTFNAVIDGDSIVSLIFVL